MFETEAEMRTVLGTIMGRYNEIIACLNSEPENFKSIFMVGPEYEVSPPGSSMQWHYVRVHGSR